jgi:hypothetical protein
VKSPDFADALALSLAAPDAEWTPAVDPAARSLWHGAPRGSEVDVLEMPQERHDRLVGEGERGRNGQREGAGRAWWDRQL